MYDGVGGEPARRLLGAVGGIGYLRLDVLECDRAPPGYVELAQIVDHHARVLSRDVTEDDVAVRLRGCSGQVDHVDDGIRAAQQLERRGRGIRRHHDAQVDHARAAYAGCVTS